MDNDFKICCSVRGFCAKGCGRQDKQLNTYDYLAGIPGNANPGDLVEVQFKHTRKGYYRNDNHLPLEKGDMVAVEASPGHDIGVVTLTGQLVPLQMKKANLKPGVEIKRVYRKARPADLEKFEESKALEEGTMIRSRKIAKDLNLNMKIGDVEYQGDGNKAIFYYIADARVDFRQLIKVLAEAFHVRIEMKQIGVRQEAGRIGGIGPCGRELCCATWMKNFNSVSTTAARFQDISPNPQKLAGQCAKLKCCLNYEVDTYVEASKKLPHRDVQLETADATYYLFKTDILAGQVTYSTDKRMAANLVTISAERAQAVIQMNKAGEKPSALDDSANLEPARPVDLVEQEDLHRFDKSKRKKNNKRRGQGQNSDVKRETKNKDVQGDKSNASVEASKDKAVRDDRRDKRAKDPNRNGQGAKIDGASADGNPNAKNQEKRVPENKNRGNRNAEPTPGRSSNAGNSVQGGNKSTTGYQAPAVSRPKNEQKSQKAKSEKAGEVGLALGRLVENLQKGKETGQQNPSRFQANGGQPKYNKGQNPKKQKRDAGYQGNKVTPKDNAVANWLKSENQSPVEIKQKDSSKPQNGEA